MLLEATKVTGRHIIYHRGGSDQSTMPAIFGVHSSTWRPIQQRFSQWSAPGGQRA